ncbi:MATE family efflux transporter, partial [Methanocaldococcus sp.]
LLKFSLLFILFDIALGIVRGEGRSREVMKASILASLSNIVLDPIFIYNLNFGIEGAAYATLLSVFFGLISLINKIRISINFSFNIAKDILRVSLPTTFVDLTTALTFFILTSLVSKVTNSYGLAVYTAALRITDLGFIPVIGLSSGTVSVIGAYYGAKDFKRLKEAYIFSIKFGVILELIITLLIIIFAPFLALLFTKENSTIYKDLVFYIRLSSLYLIIMPLFFNTASLYQGIGRGEGALYLSLLRNALRTILPYVWGSSLLSIFLGLISGEYLSAIIALVIGLYTIKKLVKL